jgi:hypothetical protein
LKNFTGFEKENYSYLGKDAVGGIDSFSLVHFVRLVAPVGPLGVSADLDAGFV